MSRKRPKHHSDRWSERQRARPSEKDRAAYLAWLDQRDEQLVAAIPVLKTAHRMAMGAKAAHRDPHQITNGKIIKYIFVEMPGHTAMVFSPEHGYQMMGINDSAELSAAVFRSRYSDFTTVTRRALVPDLFVQLYTKNPLGQLLAAKK